MSEIKVKKESIGQAVNVSGIGLITIQDDHGAMLLRRGMFEHLDNYKPLEKLKPKRQTNSRKNATTNPE